MFLERIFLRWRSYQYRKTHVARVRDPWLCHRTYRVYSKELFWRRGTMCKAAKNLFFLIPVHYFCGKVDQPNPPWKPKRFPKELMILTHMETWIHPLLVAGCGWKPLWKRSWLDRLDRPANTGGGIHISKWTGVQIYQCRVIIVKLYPSSCIVMEVESRCISNSSDLWNVPPFSTEPLLERVWQNIRTSVIDLGKEHFPILKL